MTEKPQVSILLPVYNAQHTVGSALRSIQGQTLSAFECIIVDDGSTDATSDILRDITRTDRRMRLIRTENQGIVSALNTGLALCSAPLIARMDSDDICHPRRLELQAAYMRAHPEVGVCSSRVAMFPRSRVRGGMCRYRQWLNGMWTHDDIARNIFVESPVAHPSVMLRRDEVLALDGYQENGWAEDYDLWLRYYLAGGRFAKLPQTLFAWRHTEERLTFNDRRYSLENFLRAKAHYLARRLHGQARPLYLWGAGKTGARLLKHLLRAGLDICAVIDIDPLKIGRTKRGVPVVAREDLPPPDAGFVITAVSSVGARALIRRHLCGHGYKELRDFICAG